MSGCAGTCVRVGDPVNTASRIRVFDSDFEGSGMDTGIFLDYCPSSWPSPRETYASPYAGWRYSAYIGSNVFTGFDTAIRSTSNCSGSYVAIANDTFVGNGTGVLGDDYQGMDSIFRDNAVAVAAAPPFACADYDADNLDRPIVFNNADDGCLQGSDGLIAGDPLFIYPAARDFRIQFLSPAKDSADLDGSPNPYELNDAGPGNFLGGWSDRGGRETY
jgi:hypothetical protein